MGARTPLEKMVQQIENGVERVDRKVKVDNIEYDARCRRAGNGPTIRLDLRRVELVLPRPW